MSSAETIKEFLVALGFKVDEQSFRKFDAATGLATRNVAKLGLGVVAAGAATEIFVAKIAAGLDKLYFASKRTGASAGEISAFGYAVEQMGGSAEDAQASLENLARFMRTQPGAGGLLTRMFGVKPEHLGDAAKSMNDIAVTFQRMAQHGQQPLVYRLAAMLGIDEKTMLAMEQTGQFNAEQQKYIDMLKQSGVDLDDLTQRGMVFDKQLNTLEKSFGLLADRIAGDLIGPMTWLNQKILDLVGAINGGKLGKETWADKLGDRLFEIFRPNDAHTPEEWKKIRAGIPLAGADTPTVPLAANNNIPAGSSSGIPNNNPGNLRSWGNNPVVGGFASFPTAMGGLVAMAKQLELYAQRGNDTIIGIVNKWAPASDKNNVPAYIADVASRTGFGVAQHLNMQDPQVLTTLMNAMITHENGRNPFEATLAPIAARSVTSTPGMNGVSMNQTTNITVNGSDSPQATANAIAGEQRRTNNQIVRNLAGAVQ